jgi:hypothetical protein
MKHAAILGALVALLGTSGGQLSEPESGAHEITAAPPLAPPDKRDCEDMWNKGLTEQAQAFKKQGLCAADFDCWTNRAEETICGSLGPPAERARRAGRELD